MKVPSHFKSGDVIEFLEPIKLYERNLEFSIKKGTFGRVLKTYYDNRSSLMNDSADLYLVISLFHYEEIKIFKLNYSVFYDKIVKRPAAQVLFSKE